MRRTALIILALLPLFLLSSVKVSGSVPPEGKPIDIERPDHTRPRSIEPECYYLGGYVYIICDNTVTAISGTVTRLSDNTQWSSNSTDNTLEISVSTDPDTYHLTFSLSDGTTYYGDYELTL